MNYKIASFLLVFFSGPLLSVAQPSANLTGSWGDQGNGTYINPVLNADYSDPDLIRLGDYYYMVCSEFHFMGMPVLRSSDLVNWTIVAQVYRRFDFAPEYSTFDRYAGGSWAPAIRYHDNKCWVYFCTPDEGLYMSTAARPEGPWAPLTEVKRAFHWEDPCPFWDDDGKTYLGHSYYGAGPIVIHRMSTDGKQLLDDGVTVYTGPVAEGTKFLKYNGYYYLIIPEGGVATGWQTVLRSKNIYGPYEKRVVLEMGSTGINGPHQGGLVETKSGEWWFIHFQDRGTIGRVAHLQPVSWINGWPEMGVDIDRNGIGEPVYVFKKPDVGNTFPLSAPHSSDEFNTPDLGLQWAWNHNPDEKGWSLSENPGFLTLHALHAPDIWKAPNTLTQKIMGDRGVIRAQFDLSAMNEGQRAGLCLISSMECQCGFIKQDGRVKFYATENGKTTWGDPCPSKTAWIRISIDLASDEAKLQYNQQDNNYKTILTCRNLKGGHWKGLRAGIFNFNTLSSSGSVKVNRFVYNYDGPLGNRISE